MWFDFISHKNVTGKYFLYKALNVICLLLGVLSKIGGVRKYRKISDIQGTLNDTDAAFGKAIDASQRKKTPGCK